MERVLDLYEEPYDEKRPMVCFDERPCQLLSHTREPIPMQAAAPPVMGGTGGKGRVRREDYEYKREGTCSVLAAFEPLRGWRHIEVRQHRGKREFAEVMRYLAEDVYPEAEQIRVVLDNLNTHTPGAFYERFAPEVAHTLARRIEFVYTPEHGSWLNMAEIELSVFERQCLGRRIESMERLASEAAAYERDRNAKAGAVDWRFTTSDARIKLKSLYPSIHD